MFEGLDLAVQPNVEGAGTLPGAETKQARPRTGKPSVPGVTSTGRNADGYLRFPDPLKAVEEAGHLCGLAVHRQLRVGEHAELSTRGDVVDGEARHVPCDLEGHHDTVGTS
jgi:hypothetical protein